MITDDYGYTGDGNPLRNEAQIPYASRSNHVMGKLLEDAKGIVCGDRQDAYGLPEINHARTAKMWSVFLGIPITSRQVCTMNILQKCAREVNAVKRDTMVDICGYAANAEACWAADFQRDGT